MKNFLLNACFLMILSGLQAQWTTITINNTNTDISSLAAYVDTVYAGFEGDGIFKSADLGSSWTDISGNLTNKYINNLQLGPWPMIFVSTNNGPYYTMSFDQSTYFDGSGSGLTTTDISTYWLGGDLSVNDFSIGTKGGGFFTGPELNGPWTAKNNGLINDALYINDLAGYDDGTVNTFILGTDGGVYYSSDDFASWDSGNNGLSGNQLHVTGVMLLGSFSLITTESGAFTSMDYGTTWTNLFGDEKFNKLLLKVNGDGSFSIFILGYTAYYTSDLQNWIPFSVPGEVIAAAATTEDLFIATAATKSGGTIYSQPINWIITGVDDNIAEENKLKIQQNQPNPFNNYTSVSYVLPKSANVDIRLYDLMGREVKILAKQHKDKGSHRINLDAADMQAGIYTVVLKTASQSASIKIVKH
jgi:hypothetical protein